MEAEIVFIINIPETVFKIEKEKNLFNIALSRATHIAKSYVEFTDEELEIFDQSIGNKDESLKKKLFENFAINLTTSK